jgi:ribonuclease HII
MQQKYELKFMPDFSWENKYHGLVAGIDEAGRGPLAGPVVAACVILNRNNYPLQINDSKKVSKKYRKSIFENLKNSSWIGIGMVNEKIIDQINILQATKLAMLQAFEDLCKKHNIFPDMVLVDGNFVPDLNCNSQAIIKGDQKSFSIAAASIIAKETRDKIMEELDLEFPQYGWKKNMAYPTKSHLQAIKRFGICKYHRLSFRPVKEANL